MNAPIFTPTLFQNMAQTFADSLIEPSVDITADNKPYQELYNRLHDGQKRIADDTTRFKVVVCGRRWGKTEFGKYLSLSQAEQGKHVWWILPDYPMSVDVWHDLKLTLNGRWAEKHEDQRLIRTSSGGVLRIRSASDVERLKGSGLDHVIFDETASTSRQVWTEAIRPALSDKVGSATFLGTPKGVMNWFYELYQLGQDPAYADWQSWNFPSWTNPLLKAEEIEAARRLLPANLFDQEYGAKFGSNAGLIYDNFDMTRNVTAEAEYDPSRYVYWGVDDGYAFGSGEGSESYHPRVVLLFQETDWGGMNVFAERYATGESSYDETINAVLEMGYPKPELAYVDGSAAMFRGKLTERDIQNANGTHVVTEGLKNVRRLVCDGNGVALLKIHPRCTKLVKEMLLYTYSDSMASPNGERKPAKVNDHGPDALRYGAWHLRYGV